MTNEQLAEVARILGVSEDSISAMDDEIKGGMQSVLENLSVQNDEDKKAIYNALDDLWQKGSVLLGLSEVAKATGIPHNTLKNLDYDTQQTLVYEYEVVDVPDLAEKTLFAALETEELDKSQVTALADKFNHQLTAKVEEQLEDDYNMIDGIINNGSKEDIDKARANLREGIRSMESLVDNPFVSEEVRAAADEELAKMKSQLELFNMYDEVKADNWLSDMIESGSAVVTDDGGFKVNPDYYKELPRNDRHVETMTEIQAVEVMSALTVAEVQFSASTRGEDNVGITVSLMNREQRSQLCLSVM